MEKERVFCKICNTQTNLVIDSFSRYHLKTEHNGISVKDYYDLYIKKDGEGICLCGKETKFMSYNRGYHQFCCNKCSTTSDYMKEKISKSYENRDMKSELGKRQKTCIDKFGTDSYTKTEEYKKRHEETCLEKYGVKHNFLTESCTEARWKVLNWNKEEVNEKRKTFWRSLTKEEQDDINDKRKETCLEKYGFDSVSKVDIIFDKIRAANEKTGKWMFDVEKDEFQKYSYIVRTETRHNKRDLFRNWDGTDYYNGETLISNREFKINNTDHYNANVKQPTIDHKISIQYGYANNIDPLVIGSLQNLCICSRSTNSSKNYLTEEEFMEKLNEKQV